MVLAATVTAAVSWRAQELNADDLLARMDRFVTASPSFRFEGESDWTATTSAAGGGDPVHEHKQLSGSYGDGVSRVVVTSDDTVTESILTRDRGVVRVAPIAALLPAMRWQRAPDRTTGAGFDSWVFNGTARSQAIDPVIVRYDGDRPVVRFGLPVDEATAASFHVFLNEQDVTLDASGRPYRIVMRLATDEGRATAEYELSGWGDHIGVELPADSEVGDDPIDQRGVSDFSDAELLQPRGIPAGWVLQSAQVLDEDQTQQPGCEAVQIRYGSADPVTGGFLSLRESDVSCVDADAPAGATELRAGAYRGWIHVAPGDVTAQMTVGDTAIVVESDLSPLALARVLGDLAGLDLSKVPAGIPGLS